MFTTKVLEAVLRGEGLDLDKHETKAILKELTYLSILQSAAENLLDADILESATEESLELVAELEKGNNRYTPEHGWEMVTPDEELN